MEDLIRRQDAIDVVKGIDSYFVKYIESLPSAQPEQMKIEKPYIECHECKDWDRDWTPSYSDGASHYCPMIDLVTDEHFYCKYGGIYR